MMSRLRLLPLLAAALLLAAGSGQCCSNKAVEAAPAAASQPTRPTAPAAKAAAPQLDIDGLIERLKQTSAIGELTKLGLPSNVNDLIDEVKRYKRSKGTPTQLERIRAHFNGLLLKVLALLEDDPGLAADIQCARDNLWHHLMEVNA